VGNASTRSKLFTFVADHPFLYFVRDTEDNIIVVAGKVIDPSNLRKSLWGKPRWKWCWETKRGFSVELLKSLLYKSHFVLSDNHVTEPLNVSWNMFRTCLDRVCSFVRYGEVTCGSAHALSATCRMLIGLEKYFKWKQQINTKLTCQSTRNSRTDILVQLIYNTGRLMESIIYI
jgi:hypothetical protein